MARRASFRKIQGHVIGIGCALEVGRMASRTIRQHAILAADKRFVARFAFRRGMRPDQRKQILMAADLLPGREPTLNDMAFGAIGTEFAQMNVSVAIGAVFADFGKNQIRVALLAGHTPVHSEKRVAGLTVIERKSCPDGPPGRGNVAIFAGNLKPAVRGRSGRALLSGCAYRNPRKK